MRRIKRGRKRLPQAGIASYFDFATSYCCLICFFAPCYRRSVQAYHFQHSPAQNHTRTCAKIETRAVSPRRMGGKKKKAGGRRVALAPLVLISMNERARGCQRAGSSTLSRTEPLPPDLPRSARTHCSLFPRTGSHMIEATGNGNSQGNLARRACGISKGGEGGEERTMWGEAGCKKKQKEGRQGCVSTFAGEFVDSRLACFTPLIGCMIVQFCLQQLA